MQIHTKEHHDLILQFEKDYPYIAKEKEDKNLWTKLQRIYQNGEVNNLFLAYRKGYAVAKCIYLQIL